MKSIKLKEFFRSGGKKMANNIFFVFLAGVVLLSIGNIFIPSENETSASERKLKEKTAAENNDGLEERLGEMFSMVDGAGKVKVLIFEKTSEEIVVAEDEKREESRVQENSSGSDVKNSESIVYESKTVFKENYDGSFEPVVLKQLSGEIEGVVIVAEGGGNAEVRSALLRATEALLGVSAHKIEVLKMK